MKFEDVEIGKHFVYQEVVLQKVKYSAGSCCTQPHNAIYLAPSEIIRSILVENEAEVELFDGPMKINDIILKGSSQHKGATEAHKRHKAKTDANKKQPPVAPRKVLVQKYETKPRKPKKPQTYGGGPFGSDTKT